MVMLPPFLKIHLPSLLQLPDIVPSLRAVEILPVNERAYVVISTICIPVTLKHATEHNTAYGKVTPTIEIIVSTRHKKL